MVSKIILVIIIFLLLLLLIKENIKKNNKSKLYPKIYILGLKKEYIFFEDYVKSLEYKFKLNKIEYEIVLKDRFTDSFFLNKEINSYFLVLHDLSYINIKDSTEKKIISKTFVINTEQLTRTSELTKMLNYIAKGYKIIDYSIGNINILEKYNFPKSTIIYLPYQVNYHEIELDKLKNKPLTICSITPESSPHRKYIYYSLKSFDLVDITPVKGFLKERDDIIFKHKILLNTHFNPSYSTYESIRCDRLIFNKTIIFSEKSYDGSIPSDISPYIIEFDSLNDAYSKLEHITKNIDYYYNTFWEEFNLEKIDYSRSLYLKLFIDSL